MIIPIIITKYDNQIYGQASMILIWFLTTFLLSDLKIDDNMS
jgi:hypothetical protein